MLNINTCKFLKYPLNSSFNILPDELERSSKTKQDKSAAQCAGDKELNEAVNIISVKRSSSAELNSQATRP